MRDTASALSHKWRAAGRAALRGGAVWWLYGCVETSLVILLAGSKNTLAAAIPGLGISANTDFISPVFSVGALLVYPLAGAAFCGLAALLIVFTGVGSRAEALLIDRNARWPPIGTLTLAIAVGINVAYVGASNAPILLAALAGGLYLAASDRVTNNSRVYSKHPLTAILALLGLTLVANGQAPFWVRTAIDLAYVAGLAALAGALDRLHRLGRDAWIWQAEPRVEIAAGALACTMVALALTPLVRIAQWEPSSNASDHRPNVILITLDTVRADHLSLYGYGRDTTPGLRQLPATVYANASATSNWTVPTHASILTGQSPLRHGAEMSAAFPEGSPIASTSVTIAEVLQKQGYHTAAIVANSLLDPGLGFDRGFSSYDLVAVRFDDALTPISREYLLREAVRGLAEAIIARRSPVRVSADAREVNTKTGRLLETLARRPGPFFLFLNYMDAHSPYAPPAPFDTRYPGKDREFRWSTWGSHPLQDRERDHLTSQYDGAIAHLDEELGHLIERLRQLDLFDNSLIVIVGDHGEAFGEHGVVGHGSSLYQTQLHVPLLVKYPQARTATTVSTPVSGIDILPTVLDVIHSPVPAGLDGLSLRAAGSLGPRWIISESSRARGDAFTSRDAGPAEVSLSYESLKLILGAGGGTELYDLARDPAEEVSLDSRLRAGSRWRQALRDYLSQAAAPVSPGAHIDKNMHDRLRALGYLR